MGVHTVTSIAHGKEPYGVKGSTSANAARERRACALVSAVVGAAWTKGSWSRPRAGTVGAQADRQASCHTPQQQSGLRCFRPAEKVNVGLKPVAFGGVLPGGHAIAPACGSGASSDRSWFSIRACRLAGKQQSASHGEVL